MTKRSCGGFVYGWAGFGPREKPPAGFEGGDLRHWLAAARAAWKAEGFASAAELGR